MRTALQAAVQSQNCCAAFVLSGIGSLSTVGLRFAGAKQPEVLLALLPEWEFAREPDAQTGFDELVVRAQN